MAFPYCPPTWGCALDSILAIYIAAVTGRSSSASSTSIILQKFPVVVVGLRTSRLIRISRRDYQITAEKENHTPKKRTSSHQIDPEPQLDLLAQQAIMGPPLPSVVESATNLGLIRLSYWIFHKAQTRCLSHLPYIKIRNL